MTGNRFSGLESLLDLPVNLLHAVDHTGKVHELTQAGDALPFHGIRNLFRPDDGPPVLKARCGRHAGRHRGKDPQKGLICFFHHELDARQAKDIGDLMGIHEDGRRPMRNDRVAVLRNGQHAAFHVHVSVHKTRGKIMSRRIDNLGIVAYAGCGVADKGNPSPVDGDIHAVLDFMGIDIDKSSVLNDEICRASTHGHIGKFQGHLFERNKFCHGSRPPCGDCIQALPRRQDKKESGSRRPGFGLTPKGFYLTGLSMARDSLKVSSTRERRRVLLQRSERTIDSTSFTVQSRSSLKMR